MAKVKLNLINLSTTEKIAKARQIVSAMTGNANFTTPHPTLTQVTTATDDFDSAFADAQAARQNALTKTSILREKEDALDVVLRQLAAYVESISGEDDTKILSAGLNVRGAGASPSALSSPESLSATEGDHDGEIDLFWDKVKSAKSYIIERSADPPSATSWAHEAVALKSSAVIGGLTSGTRYWFRVAAIRTDGQSGWSDPATKIAP